MTEKQQHSKNEIKFEDWLSLYPILFPNWQVTNSGAAYLGILRYIYIQNVVISFG